MTLIQIIRDTTTVRVNYSEIHFYTDKAHTASGSNGLRHQTFNILSDRLRGRNMGKREEN